MYLPPHHLGADQRVLRGIEASLISPSPAPESEFPLALSNT
jgi:hypothetical protein